VNRTHAVRPEDEEFDAMTKSSAIGILVRAAAPAALLMFSTPVIAQTVDHAPVDLPDAQLMAQDKAGSESWTYVNPSVNFTTYRNVIVDAASVYTGPDAQFDHVSPEERDQYAAIMTGELQSDITKAFPPPSGPPSANTLRLNVILLGVQKTVGGVATATRATPIGLGLNVFKSLTGKKGTLTGSVLLAVEGYNAKTGELLFTAVRRRTPNPLDIPATLSTTDTVKAVARDFANDAVLKLQNMMGAP
jgi:hypothetical protein